MDHCLYVRTPAKLAHEKKGEGAGKVLAYITGKDSMSPRTYMMLSDPSLSHPGCSLSSDYFLLLQMASNMRTDGWSMSRSNSNVTSRLYIIF